MKAVGRTTHPEPGQTAGIAYWYLSSLDSPDKKVEVACCPTPLMNSLPRGMINALGSWCSWPVDIEYQDPARFRHDLLQVLGQLGSSILLATLGQFLQVDASGVL